MFSHEPRCIYRNNQLAEVICQLRFPEILAIGAKLPVDFQEAIRDEFPVYSARKEIPAPRISGTPGNFSIEKQEPIINYQFASADGVWRVNLTGNFISLACTRYTSWEDFAAKLDKPLVSFIKTYKPAYFQRVGLRYVNFFSRQALELEEIPFSELFTSSYLGLLGEEDVAERSVGRSSVDAEVNLRAGCKAKIHAGPGLVKRGGSRIRRSSSFSILIFIWRATSPLTPLWVRCKHSTLRLFPSSVVPSPKNCMNPCNQDTYNQLKGVSYALLLRLWF